MTALEWFLVDLVILIYNLSWFMFLTYQHYGQVTTTAGHLFELNVLLNANIMIFLLIFFVDFEALSLGSIEIIDVQFGLLVALAGSQIETMVFLKTLRVNTMMTNTAAKIILAMTIFSYGLAVFNTLAWPSTMVPISEILSCAYLTPMAMDFNRQCIMIFIYTATLVIVLSVMGFGVFRGLQIRGTSDSPAPIENLSLEELGHERGMGSRDNPNNDTLAQGRLFTIQAVISELDQVTPREIVEEDLVIQDIELDSMHISPSTTPNNVSETETQQNTIGCDTPSLEVQQDTFGCLSVIDMIMKLIQKYLKNTIMSLLILVFLLPWYLTFTYGFISNSGCEDPIIKIMVEMSEYSTFFVSIFLPLVIKLKLERLSE